MYYVHNLMLFSKDEVNAEILCKADKSLKLVCNLIVILNKLFVSHVFLYCMRYFPKHLRILPRKTYPKILISSFCACTVSSENLLTYLIVDYMHSCTIHNRS